ncbi:MAG: two-component system response regulator CreB [Desulfosarcinaceae bacterium]
MRPRILIVEDEPAIADTLQYALETDGFDPCVAADGATALEQLDAGPIDLVILDVGLPDVNGFELCKQIRKSKRVPIIFLTARNDEVDRVVGLEIGGDDYVVKPFSPRELTARVKAVLRRSRTGRQPPEEDAAAFTVDASKRRICFFGSLLELSRYEYEILKIFIGRPGHVYTRDRLMDAVWDAPEASMDRTVDAHIKNIRAKLKAVNPDLDPIVTHRGTGYSLREDL